jgi:hypothetical protein
MLQQQFMLLGCSAAAVQQCSAAHFDRCRATIAQVLCDPLQCVACVNDVLHLHSGVAGGHVCLSMSLLRHRPLWRAHAAGCSELAAMQGYLHWHHSGRLNDSNRFPARARLVGASS